MSFERTTNWPHFDVPYCPIRKLVGKIRVCTDNIATFPVVRKKLGTMYFPTLKIPRCSFNEVRLDWNTTVLIGTPTQSRPVVAVYQKQTKEGTVSKYIVFIQASVFEADCVQDKKIAITVFLHFCSQNSQSVDACVRSRITIAAAN